MNDDIFLYSGWDKDGEIAMDRILRDIPLRMNCVSIGRIEKVYDQMADVSIIYKRDDGYVHPVLRQVPLLVLQGGKKFIKFPVANGDICLLLFCDRDISRWHARGEERQMPPSERNHNINDAIAICGLNYMGRGLGEDNYKGEDGKPAIQINGKGNHFVKYNELEKALKEFRDDLIDWVKYSTYVSAAGVPTKLTTQIVEPKIDIEPAKTLGIETGSDDTLAENIVIRPEEELEQLKISEPLGIYNLKKMYKLLAGAKGTEGELLRDVWDKYEDKLRVHDNNYGSDSDMPKADKNASGEYGIFIKLSRDVKETIYLNDYQQIFHEFFHSIDFIVGRSSTNKNDTFTWIYKSNAFAKIIKDEANDIKKKGDIVKIQQRSNLNDQKERAYLFDILGGVLNGDRIKWLDGVSTEFGHDKSYWRKDSAKLDGGDVYNALIAAETFANMASSAITNINAFNLMKDYLPKSYDMFIEILGSIL